MPIDRKKNAEGQENEPQAGTSIFDPVLCELAYLWFSKAGDTIIDPFAGGSVRGIVAAKLGRKYVGVDLRAEQIEANREQWQAMGDATNHAPDWRVGDSRDISAICKGIEADMLFTCPPYADLERYSDDQADLSTMQYNVFIEAFREGITRSCALLGENRFAVIVVGEARGPDGCYYNFVGDTTRLFMEAGLNYYNEAILVTSVGSLPIRAGKAFSASRKLGKTHQNVLVFVKGDWKKATEHCGKIEIPQESFDGYTDPLPETNNK